MINDRMKHVKRLFVISHSSSYFALHIFIKIIIILLYYHTFENNDKLLYYTMTQAYLKSFNILWITDALKLII